MLLFISYQYLIKPELHIPNNCKNCKNKHQVFDINNIHTMTCVFMLSHVHKEDHLHCETCCVCSGSWSVLTDVCREGDLVDSRVQVDDVGRGFERVKVSCQPLEETEATEHRGRQAACQQNTCQIKPINLNSKIR